MKAFRQWIRSKLSTIDEIEAAPEYHDEEIWRYLGWIIRQAGERALRLGLPHLYERSLDFGRWATCPEAKLYLSECLKALRTAQEHVPDGPTLTVTQAARLLQIKRDTVLAWIASGKLKATNVAKGQGKPRYRVARTDLDGFLAGRTRQREARPKRRPRVPGAVTRYFPEA